MNRQAKIGDTIRIKTTTYSNYGVSKGDKLTVVALSGSSVTVYAPSYGNMNITKNAYEISTLTKEELQTNKKELQAEIKEIDEKIEFIEQTGEIEFNSTLYKTMKVLAVIDSKKGSQLEKAKAIAKLVDGNQD